jgi:short-subunit dehydrogenase
MRIDGAVAVITGASEGIGAACAREFARRGALLALVARNAERLDAVGSPGSLLLAGDLCDEGFRANIVTRVLDRYGRVDILINNAGVGLYGSSAEAPLTEVRRIFELNFFAPFDLSQRAIPHMARRRSGMIVNVSSTAGRLTLPWMTVYSATKFALFSLTEGQRMELASQGIHAMAVLPGYVLTKFQQSVISGTAPPAVLRARRGGTTPERCARAIASGVERNARTVFTPRIGRLLIAAARAVPALTERRLARMLAREESA